MLFFICYLAGSQLALGHYQGDSLTQAMNPGDLCSHLLSLIYCNSDVELAGDDGSIVARVVRSVFEEKVVERRVV